MHVHSLLLSSLVTICSTLETTLAVVGAVVVVTVENPSHLHVIIANGLPLTISHERTTLLPSITGSAGVCVIDGGAIGESVKNLFKIKSGFCYNYSGVRDK